MPSLPVIPPVPHSTLVALGIGAGLIAFLFWLRISRTRYVVLQASESVQTAVVQLERIANAMDRIVFLSEARQRSLEAEQAMHAKSSSEAAHAGPDTPMAMSATAGTQ